MEQKVRKSLDKNLSLANEKLYQERNYEEALEHAFRAMECAKLLDDKENVIESRLLIGHIYLNSMYNLEYALEHYIETMEMIELMDKEEENFYYLICSHALGRVYRILGRLNDAIPILEELIDKEADPDRKLSILNDLGLTYWRKGTTVQDKSILKEAIRIYDLALETCEQLGLMEYKAITLNNKGMVFYDLEKYDSAIVSFEKALELTDDSFYIACISNEIAKTYLKLGNFHMSKKFINKANKILIDYEDEQVSEIELLRNLAIEGLYQRKMGNFEDAVHYFEMAVNKIEDKELRIEAAETFHQLSLMLKERGDIRSGRYALKFEELAKEIEEEEKKVSTI